MRNKKSPTNKEIFDCLKRFPLEGAWWFSDRSFHELRHGIKHVAIDVFGRRGDPVLSPVDGEIVEVWHAEDTRKAGNAVLIKIDGLGDIYCYMAHMGDVYKSEGMMVKAGDMVGTMANEGCPTTRCHLHIQLYRLYGRNKKSFVNFAKKLRELADPKLSSKSRCEKDRSVCKWCNS